jgi:hypothetical protein
MDSKRCWWKWPWSDLRYGPIIYLERLRKTINNLGIAILWTNILTWGFPEKKRECGIHYVSDNCEEWTHEAFPHTNYIRFGFLWVVLPWCQAWWWSLKSLCRYIFSQGLSAIQPVVHHSDSTLSAERQGEFDDVGGPLFTPACTAWILVSLGTVSSKMYPTRIFVVLSCVAWQRANEFSLRVQPLRPAALLVVRLPPQ